LKEELLGFQYLELWRSKYEEKKKYMLSYNDSYHKTITTLFFSKVCRRNYQRLDGHFLSMKLDFDGDGTDDSIIFTLSRANI